MSGFIDLQVNGYAGACFTKAGLTLDVVRSVTDALLERGTAAYCPTICTTSPEVFRANLNVLATAFKDDRLRRHLLGIHVEGPFFTPESRGAHPLEHLRTPDADLVRTWQDWADGHIRLLTMAPELEGAEDAIRAATELDICVSLGHHLGSVEAITRAVDAGARASTHLGNGIANSLPRHPNPLWTQLAEDRLTGMFITDGHHIPPEFIKAALRTKGVERFVVVSDVSTLAGLPPGVYQWLGGDCRVCADGRILTAKGDCLAGSSSTMRECMHYLESLDLLTDMELRRVSVDNPLALIGLSDWKP